MERCFDDFMAGCEDPLSGATPELMLFAAIVRQAIEDYIQGELLLIGVRKIKHLRLRQTAKTVGGNARHWLFGGFRAVGTKVGTMHELAMILEINVNLDYVRAMVVKECKQRLQEKTLRARLGRKHVSTVRDYNKPDNWRQLRGVTMDRYATKGESWK